LLAAQDTCEARGLVSESCYLPVYYQEGGIAS